MLNGKNERGHYVAHMSIVKVMEEEMTICVERASDRACNLNILIGYLEISPLQIANGPNP